MKFLTKNICALTQVAKKTSKFDITHVLSLIDQGHHPYYHPERPVEKLLLYFEDTSNPHSPIGPKIEHVERVLNWAEKIPEDKNLLVHCYAGMSRSTSMAIAIECKRNGVKTIDEIDEVYDYFHKLRPIMLPNKLIIEYTDYLLDLNGKLIQKNLEFHRKNYPKHGGIFVLREDD